MGQETMPAAGNAPAVDTPKKSRRPAVILGLIVLTMLGVGFRMWWKGHHFESTDNAYLVGHVNTVSSRVSGVVTKVLVSDNQAVQAGDELAELDNADQVVKITQIEAQLAQMDAQVKQAQAQVELSRAEALSAQAQLSSHHAQLKKADAEAGRYMSLYSDQMKAVAKAELDSAVAARDSATADVRSQGSQVAAATARISANEYSVAALLAQKRVLAAQLQDAQLQLRYHKIFAPVSGRIGRKSIEVGLRVQAGQQLMGIVQQGGWLVANFKETQIASLHPGQKASIRIDAFPQREFTGHIESFSPASGAQFSLLPPDNATGNFTKIVQRVPVKIVFDAKDLQSITDRVAPGMSANVEIDLRQGEPNASNTASIMTPGDS